MPVSPLVKRTPRYHVRMSKPASKRASAQSGENRLRIVGGRWRSMRVDFPPIAAIRPTPDRVRETLFNWLQTKILNARCLDLFAGSGALGLEALSRGASHVTFVDREPVIVRHLTTTLARFQAANATAIASDALTYLRNRDGRFDIVFLDPPFAADLLAPVCQALAQDRLNPDAYVYLESSAREGLPRLPEGWTVYRSKRAGEVGYHLVRVARPTAESPS